MKFLCKIKFQRKNIPDNFYKTFESFKDESIFCQRGFEPKNKEGCKMFKISKN